MDFRIGISSKRGHLSSLNTEESSAEMSGTSAAAVFSGVNDVS